MTGSLDPGILVIQGTVCEGIDFDTAKTKVFDSIFDYIESGINERSLQKVKNQTESSLAFMEVEILNKAMNLAMAANSGDPNLVNQEADKINQVSIEEMKNWADKLFKKGCHHVLWYQKNQ